MQASDFHDKPLLQKSLVHERHRAQRGRAGRKLRVAMRLLNLGKGSVLHPGASGGYEAASLQIKVSDVQKSLDQITLGGDFLHFRVGILPAVPGVLLTALTKIPTALGKVFLSRFLMDTYMKTDRCRYLDLRSEAHFLLHLKIIVGQIFQGPKIKIRDSTLLFPMGIWPSFTCSMFIPLSTEGMLHLLHFPNISY